ncbi:hypothetical protein BJ508DRAFT_418809 [Ascobolus immersus RN42]|uniref:Uncharacterized protein n=1 Tax=Ascobolus immersus RN42 TaxID=1160509 RepID=A0A3N4HPQ4_ASCIM|nr:hypothetical protein BJ508DRAFT_418809 [Ascobolus immersus RN42]
MSVSKEEELPMYGIRRPKNKPTAIPLTTSSIHSLSTELALAKARAETGERESKRAKKNRYDITGPSNKEDIYKTAKDYGKSKLKFVRKEKDELGNLKLTEEEYQRSRKAMEEKAKRYDQLKRKRQRRIGLGYDDDEDDDMLIDFGRKAEEADDIGMGGSTSRTTRDDDSDSSFENSDDDDPFKGREGEELIEYIDEFGRSRMVPKSWAEKQERLLRMEEEMSALPSRPENLIYGPTVQTEAIQVAEFPTFNSSNYERKKPNHYDATAEVRTKGVGFFAFSHDENIRKKEMEELMREREVTERKRAEAEARRKRRKEEVEMRKEEIRRRRREKQGATWLENVFDQLDGFT